MPLSYTLFSIMNIENSVDSNLRTKLPVLRRKHSGLRKIHYRKWIFGQTSPSLISPIQIQDEDSIDLWHRDRERPLCQSLTCRLFEEYSERIWESDSEREKSLNECVKRLFNN